MSVLDRLIASRATSVRFRPYYRPYEWLPSKKTLRMPFRRPWYDVRVPLAPLGAVVVGGKQRATPMPSLQNRIGNVRLLAANRYIYQPPVVRRSTAGDEVVMSDRRRFHTKMSTLPVPKRPPEWKPYDPFSDPDVEWFNLWKKSNEITEKSKRPGPFSRPRWEICLKREMRRMVLHALGMVGKGIHASSGYPHWTKDSLVRC